MGTDHETGTFRERAVGYEVRSGSRAEIEASRSQPLHLHLPTGSRAVEDISEAAQGQIEPLNGAGPRGRFRGTDTNPTSPDQSIWLVSTVSPCRLILDCCGSYSDRECMT